MGMGFAPTWLRQVSPLLHKTTLNSDWVYKRNKWNNYLNSVRDKKNNRNGKRDQIRKLKHHCACAVATMIEHTHRRDAWVIVQLSGSSEGACVRGNVWRGLYRNEANWTALATVNVRRAKICVRVCQHDKTKSPDYYDLKLGTVVIDTIRRQTPK